MLQLQTLPASVRYQLVLDLLNKTPKFTAEWFQLKEEEIQLRSHPDTQELTCTALVRDIRKEVEAREVHDRHVGESRDENISILESDRHAIKVGNCPSSRDHFPHDSRNSQTVTKIGAYDTEGNTIDVIADVFSAATCTGSTADNFDSPNPIGRKERIRLGIHLESLSSDVPHNFDFEDKPAPMKNAGVETASEMLGNTYDEAPPLPFVMRSDMFEGGPKSKNSGIEPFLAMPGSTDPIVPGSSTLPQAYTDTLSQSVSNEHEEDSHENENAIIIPEAFLVEANASFEERDVGVAELVEPDQSTVLLKKRHACVATILLAAILIALGLTIAFILGRNSRNNETLETSLPSFSPSSRPSSAVPSLQPSINIRYEIEKNVLQRNVTFEGMQTTDERLLALDWITDTDPMKLVASASNLFQRYILALLAHEFSNLDWLSDGSNECEWLGVECDMYGRVIELKLNDSSLDGTVPPEIGKLQYLQSLLLSDNSLRGTIPSELGNLKELSILSLNLNTFTGSLPSEIGNLNELSQLELSSNHLKGSLPPEVCYLTSLTYLSILGNQFTGSLPTEVGHLTSLTNLNFFYNQFAGTLPSELSLLTSLTELTVSYNQFTGNLPSELGLLTSLTTLSVDGNQFTGTLPSVLGLLTSLTDLQLGENQFTGILPSELGLLTSLVRLSVTSNQLSGTLPFELFLLTSMTELWLGYNEFTGTLPSEIGHFASILYLSVGSNQFTGTLPSELGKLTSLVWLDIGNNEFTGTFPSWMGNFQNLSQLWLQNNLFTGTFPAEIENNLDLVEFCIRNNDFTGILPKEIKTEWYCF